MNVYTIAGLPAKNVFKLLIFNYYEERRDEYRKRD